MANATPREIKVAFEGLSDSQLAKLSAYCGYRIKSLGRNAPDLSVKDIMQEVFRRIFDTRTWKKDKCDFDYHIKMTISSVVDEYKKRLEKKSENLDIKLESDIGTKEGSFLIEHTCSNESTPTTERVIDAKDKLNSLLDFFKASPLLYELLTLKMEGYKSSEISELLNLTDLEFKKRDRMLRRKLKDFEQGETNE